MRHPQDEQGFALLFTIFIIAITTILVMDFAGEMRTYQRSSRSFAETIRANFMLKSAVHLAKALLQAPKNPDTKDEDWMGEPWAAIAAAPQLPIEIAGEIRLAIVDEDGKIDANAMTQGGGGFGGLGGSSFQGQPQPVGGAAAPASANPWRDALGNLMTLLEFQREEYPAKAFRTLGNVSYEASDQVAVMMDWLDADSESYHAPGFPGQGIEGSADKSWFYNQRFRSLSQLALVPGMTLERVQRLAPFVKASIDGNSRAVNVNTAPPEVLIAVGLTQAQASEIMSQRLNLPITNEILRTLTAADPSVTARMKVRSGEFSAYARVKTATKVAWVRAIITAQASGLTRKTTIKSWEFY